MRWLHVLPSLDPRFGGPIQGVRNIGLRLCQEGHSVEVVTLDDPTEEFLREFPLVVHALGPSKGNYRYTKSLVPWLRMHALEFDAVVINGIWQFSSFGAWRALRNTGVPYFVFTHGMLDPWFKQAYPFKHLKKWLYWPWADYRVLRDARGVLFTCNEERLLARQSFWLYRAREQVIGYGIHPPPADEKTLSDAFFDRYPRLKNKRIVLFLGRIHEKKGCDVLINAFARVASSSSALSLVMAGPDEHGWTKDLKILAQTLGVSERITWPGMLQGDLKWGALYASDVFILPSHQENFGIAVAEALSCKLPVIISDKVNIWREIQQEGAGIVDTDTVEGTERSLKLWLTLSSGERRQMGLRAEQCYLQHFNIDSMTGKLLDVLMSAKA